jgi:hypothetical protein
MIGLSIAKLLMATCWENFDFPEPGGPTNRTIFLSGTSCNWLKEDKNDPITE